MPIYQHINEQCVALANINDFLGTMNSGLKISCTIAVDPQKETNRGFFSQTDRRARNLTATWELKNKYTCFNYPVYVLVCYSPYVF